MISNFFQLRTSKRWSKSLSEELKSKVFFGEGKNEKVYQLYWLLTRIFDAINLIKATFNGRSNACLRRNETNLETGVECLSTEVFLPISCLRCEQIIHPIFTKKLIDKK